MAGWYVALPGVDRALNVSRRSSDWRLDTVAQNPLLALGAGNETPGEAYRLAG